MTRHSIGQGLYRAGAVFWLRTAVSGRRSWRRLASLTVTDARAEARALVSDHARSRLGLVKDPFAAPCPTIAEILANRPPSGPLRRVLRAWGTLRADQITATMAMWCEPKGRERAADIEVSILSSALSEAVRRGALAHNPLVGRKRFQDPRTIEHSRNWMPRDADELNRLAIALLAVPASRSVGWQLLIAALTGCRTSELLALRMDAEPRAPGWVEARYLYVRRSKGGLFPFVELTPELEECIEAHHAWHALEVPRSPWWFPGPDLYRPLGRTALTQALGRVARRLGLGKRTAHGLRAYHVTVWRSRGESNERVAARIGDRTSALIESTYGALPESWAGGEPLGWRPVNGREAWRMSV